MWLLVTSCCLHSNCISSVSSSALVSVFGSAFHMEGENGSASGLKTVRFSGVGKETE